MPYTAPMSSSSHILPAHVAPWIDAALGLEIPAETHATCDACAMCEGGGDGRRPRGPLVFSDAVKCCAYVPELPNYLVGAILADGSAGGDAGRRTTLERIERGGSGVHPLGLIPRVAQTPALGATTPVCPHLDEGRCSIWNHRHAVCATWFCKHERGALGHAAWLALRALMVAIERELALWCCVEEGFDPQALARLVATSSAVPWLQVADGTEPASTWGDRRGAEQDFFIACHARVRGLTWDDVVRITGPTVGALARSARAAFEALGAPLPDVLEPGRYTVVAVGDEGLIARTYSEADPIALPALLTSVLHLFDGRATAEVAEQLLTERAMAIDADFLRTLVDFRVLVEKS